MYTCSLSRPMEKETEDTEVTPSPSEDSFLARRINIHKQTL
ncbi:unnamed protein product [Phyllotreta striolata]|uniref:Uncharacterized protein n=1 Tax=Phyllotreta striolata TaxID=444603 RepID=A0A9N9XT63_PHYSR|nr:unnamed protein product [Phyllotreta striolata]